MKNKPVILPYTQDLDVGVNEIIQRFSFNRNSTRLLSNDFALEGLYLDYLEELNIFEYTSGRLYHQGDLIWVKRSKGDFKLFLVRCIIDENSSNLQNVVDAAYVPGAAEQPEPDFDRYGWKNENSYLKIEDYGIPAKLRRYFLLKFDEHERSDTYHRFGPMSTSADADAKILLADLSNVDKNRDIVFFPYYTCKIDQDDCILYGYYRVWDCGTLEVDLVYRLGYRGAEDVGGFSMDVLQCNDYSMRSVQYANSETNKYFSTNGDRDIFAPLSCGQSLLDDIVQLNRNDVANTYSAQIKFPRFWFNGKSIQFLNNQYMIFGSDVMSQDANCRLGQIEPGANCMMYCNKSKQGFTALYVTYPDNASGDQEPGFNADNGGLVSNSFHCHIVGQWMEDPIQV